MEGFLQTKNYQQFTVVDEGGKVLYSFEGAKKANRCLPGDCVVVRLCLTTNYVVDSSGADNTVVVKDDKITLKERVPSLPIAGYLELDSKTTYGSTKRHVPLYLFTPLNPSYPPFIVSSSETNRVKKVALIDFLEWEETRELPRGALKQLIGNAGTLEAEEAGLLWSTCPWTGLKAGIEVLADDCPKRQPIGGFTFNVDPAGCKDIDDCVSFEEIGENEWWITITISDVASCVEEMGAVDCMAAVQGQTLYRDGTAIRPMLPPALSEEACSLVAGTERRGVSLSFCWRIGEGIDGLLTWSESVIKNDKTYTYENVPEAYAKLLTGCTSVIAGRSVTDAHEWIEVLMKLYNCEAAKLLVKAGVGILRRHSAPDLDRLAKYTAMRPELAALANAAAAYCLVGEPDTTHFGLGTDAYCHATSPIRRYADLANQRILKQVIRGNMQGLCVSVPVADLNLRAKVSKAYERDRVFLNCLLGAGKREFEALVLDVGEKVVLWIPEWSQKVKCVTNRSVAEGQTVVVRCAMNIGARRWKERLVIEIL